MAYAATATEDLSAAQPATAKADPSVAGKEKQTVKVADATTPPPAANGTPAGSNAAAANGAPVANSDSVEEMTVTARRRSERLKDVPAAVTPLTGGQLEQLGITDTKQLLQEVAGTTLVSGGPDVISDISMRGQGSGRNGVSETSTGLFENGAYIAGGNFNGRAPTEINLFDLDRVEILHGPQGALYGRNAVGGSINFIVNKPEMDFSTSEQVSYGSARSFDFQGILNEPIDPELGIAARLGGFANNQEEGFIQNTGTGDWLDATRSRGARLGLSYQPNSDTKIYGQLEYYDQNQPSIGSLGYAPTDGLLGTTRVGQQVDPDPYKRSYLDREGRSDSEDVTGYLSVDRTTSIGVLSLKLYDRHRDASSLGSDWDHFLTIAGSTPGATTGGGGLDGTLIDLAQDQTEAFNLADAQLTLTSTGNGRFKWLVGLEGLKSRDGIVSGFENCPVYTGTGAIFNPGCIPGAYANPGVNPLSLQYKYADPAALFYARAAMNHNESTEILTSTALFGSASFDVTPWMTVGAEGRIVRDRKTYAFQAYSQDPLADFSGVGKHDGYGGSLTFPGFGSVMEYCPPYIPASSCTATGSAPTFYANEEASWNEVLPGASLRFKLTPEQIVYLRYATGYRPGGFNNPNSSVLQIYKPERSFSYEVGWKGSLLGVDIDTDVYSQTTRDVQVTTYGGNGALIIIQNPGNAYVYGVEANFNKKFEVGPGKMSVGLGLSSNYGRYYDTVSFQPTIGAANLSIDGDRVPRTRNIQGSLNTSYALPLYGGSKRAIFGSSWQFASGGYETPQNSRPYNGYGKLDLRATLASSEGWAVTAFGKNIFDRRYEQQSINTLQFWSQPATFGITLSLTQ